jgi:glycerol-3-phosphate acyltransferase PlsY
MALYVASAVVAYLFAPYRSATLPAKYLPQRHKKPGKQKRGCLKRGKGSGTKAGLAVLLLDFAKGFLTVMFLPVIMGHLPFPQAADTSEGMIKVFVLPQLSQGIFSLFT